MRVQVIRAWPHRHEVVELELREGARVGDAIAAAGFAADAEISGQAVFGQAVSLDDVLRDGDRVELLRPLVIDPKEARRRRARR